MRTLSVSAHTLWSLSVPLIQEQTRSFILSHSHVCVFCLSPLSDCHQVLRRLGAKVVTTFSMVWLTWLLSSSYICLESHTKHFFSSWWIESTDRVKGSVHPHTKKLEENIYFSLTSKGKPSHAYSSAFYSARFWESCFLPPHKYIGYHTTQKLLCYYSV